MVKDLGKGLDILIWFGLFGIIVAVIGGAWLFGHLARAIYQYVTGG